MSPVWQSGWTLWMRLGASPPLGRLLPLRARALLSFRKRPELTRSSASCLVPPVTTSTTDLKQLSLPRRLLDGRVELGSELTHRMLRNRALVERRLTRQAPYEEF